MSWVSILPDFFNGSLRYIGDGFHRGLGDLFRPDRIVTMLTLRRPNNSRATVLAISRTQALRQLLSRIGQSTYHLNTITVGLECVANGQGDGEALALPWFKPQTIELQRDAAARALSFACSGALVLAADVFESYIRELATDDSLQFSSQTVDIATKRKTRSKQEGGEYSVAERMEAICSELSLNEPVKIAALDLLSKWRNVVAHSSERKAQLKSDFVQLLDDAASDAIFAYPDFSIGAALSNFRDRKPPSAGEVTTLVATAVRLSRCVDEAAIKRAFPSGQAMRHAAEHILRTFFQSAHRSKHTRHRKMQSFQHGSPSYRHRMIVKVLAAGGIARTSHPVSAALDASYIRELSALPPADVALRLMEAPAASPLVN